MKLTDDFTVYQMCKNEIALRRNMDNKPPPHIIENLKMLCVNVLQPVRNHFGAPIKVISGYRCIDVNLAVGGSRNSDHTRGIAADIEIPGFPNYDLAVWIAENCQFTELKLEMYTPAVPDSGWVHVSYNPRDLKCVSTTSIRTGGKIVIEQGLRP